jgi:hypothetical protein
LPACASPGDYRPAAIRVAAASTSSEDDRVKPGGAAAVKRVGLVAWLALVVIVAIWTERRIDHRADAPARAPGPAPRTATAPRRPVVVAAAEPDRAGPLRLDGRVIGPDGRAVPGAVVTLDPDVARSTTTDAAGRSRSTRSSRACTRSPHRRRG